MSTAECWGNKGKLGGQCSFVECPAALPCEMGEDSHGAVAAGPGLLGSRFRSTFHPGPSTHSSQRSCLFIDTFLIAFI
jgi:hypothetical protein